MAWYTKLSSLGLVRMYTLNYDRNFKMLAKATGVDAFEGFKDHKDELGDRKLDLHRILTDIDSPVHYNLHGSTHWQVHPRDEYTQLINPWISLTPFHSFEMNSSESTVAQVDRGRSFQVSNIISGYQKSHKSLISPFRQMQAAFDRDCMVADEIIVIGYSLGDYHINSSIINALKANQKVKIHLIDPIYSGKQGYDILVQRKIKILSDLFHFKRTELVYSDDNHTCSYFEDRLCVTSTGFAEFLRYV
ncbi:SIR2 family protein [Pseudochryseolinea flava]|nr:SIR2 family protein [Pseudochryseolinea flava]